MTVMLRNHEERRLLQAIARYRRESEEAEAEGDYERFWQARRAMLQAQSELYSPRYVHKS